MAMSPMAIGAVVVLLLVVAYAVSRNSVAVTPTGGITSSGHPAATPIDPGTSVPATVATVNLPTTLPSPTPSVPTPSPSYLVGQAPPILWVPPAPAPPASPPAPTAPTVPAPVLTSKIRVFKDFTGLGDAYLQIGEVYVYSGSRLLTKSDFSSATLTSTFGVIGDNSANSAIDGDPNSFAVSYRPSVPIQALDLTLTQPMQITKVSVLNRQDCCQSRLNGAKVALFGLNGESLFTATLTGQREVQVFSTGM